MHSQSKSPTPMSIGNFDFSKASVPHSQPIDIVSSSNRSRAPSNNTYPPSPTFIPPNTPSRSTNSPVVPFPMPMPTPDLGTSPADITNDRVPIYPATLPRSRYSPTPFVIPRLSISPSEDFTQAWRHEHDSRPNGTKDAGSQGLLVDKSSSGEKQDNRQKDLVRVKQERDELLKTVNVLTAKVQQLESYQQQDDVMEEKRTRKQSTKKLSDSQTTVVELETLLTEMENTSIGSAIEEPRQNVRLNAPTESSTSKTPMTTSSQESELESLKQQLNAVLKDNAKLQERLSKEQHKYRALEKKHTKLEQSLASSGIQTIKIPPRNEHNISDTALRVKSLESRCNELEKRLSQEKEKNERLKKELGEVNAVCDKLRNENGTLKTYINGWKERYNEVLAQLHRRSS